MEPPPEPAPEPADGTFDPFVPLRSKNWTDDKDKTHICGCDHQSVCYYFRGS